MTDTWVISASAKGKFSEILATSSAENIFTMTVIPSSYDDHFDDEHFNDDHVHDRRRRRSYGNVGDRPGRW